MVEPNNSTRASGDAHRGPKSTFGQPPFADATATFSVSPQESDGGPVPPPPPPPGPPPQQPPPGGGGDLVDMLTKTVLPLLVGSSGRAPKWLPMVLGGACAGAGLAYVLFRDSDQPRSTPRGLTAQPVTSVPRSTPYPPGMRRPSPYPLPTMGVSVVRGRGEMPLGFVYEAVPGKRGGSKKAASNVASNVVDVTSRPQSTFHGERLVVPSGIANFFEIRDIRVGRRSQLASAEALPAAAFSENAETVQLVLEVALVGQDVTLVVENITARPHRFTAALVGAQSHGLA